MPNYQIIKNPSGSGYLIDDGSGGSIRYATKALAARTIERWQALVIEGAALAAERREARMREALAYLAVRAARKAEAEKQLAFAF